jgi:ethanolamine ammonia-lyase small subunit
MKPPVTIDSWDILRRFTSARIALGRAGDSLPTQALLQFELAHAQARDAVYRAFEPETLTNELQQAGFETLSVKSQASDRQQYLLRPDLGRQLDEVSRRLIYSPQQKQTDPKAKPTPDVVFIVGDGLAPQAPLSYALPLLCKLRESLSDWNFAPLVIAQFARVALSDDIGALLGAKIAVILIGERPGLSSPCSMGAYITYAPRIGRSDAERNCISNINAVGLSCEDAAKKLHYLLDCARRLKISGVTLKDNSDAKHLTGSTPTS